MSTIFDYSDIVYDFIWDYLVEHEVLPSSKQIAEALDWAHAEVLACVAHLRFNNRLEPTTLKPTAYDAWWRENARDRQTWQLPNSLRLSTSGRLVMRKLDRHD